MFSIVRKRMCKNVISFYLTVCFVCLLYVNYIHQLPLSAFCVSGKECRTTSKPCSLAVPPDVFCLVSVGHVRSGLPDQESLQRRATCWRPGRTCLESVYPALSPISALDLGTLSRNVFSLTSSFLPFPIPSF